MILRVIQITTLILLWIPLVSAQSMSASQIIEKAQKNRNINDFLAQADMTIYRPTWERSIGIKTWGKSIDMGHDSHRVAAEREGTGISQKRRRYMELAARDRKNS